MHTLSISSTHYKTISDFISAIQTKYSCQSANLVSDSNNFVYSLDNKIVLKVLFDKTTDNRIEYLVSQTCSQVGKCFIDYGSVQIGEGTYQYDLSKFSDGSSLDKLGKLSIADMQQIVAIIDGITERTLPKFGKIDPNMFVGQSSSWFIFLKEYLEKQVQRGNGASHEFGGQIKDLLDSFESILGIEKGFIIPMDLNKRNFLKQHDGRIVLINTPVVWVGDKLAAYGEILAHFWEELNNHNLMKFFKVSDMELKKIYIYCFFMLFTTLVYVERMNKDQNIKNLSPWGSRLTFYSLLQAVYGKIGSTH